MASAFVLYLDDAIVGPCCELIRNICQPESTSKPHITVRFRDKLPVGDEYRTTAVSYVDMVKPGAFGLSDSGTEENKIVYIKCDSEDLDALSYKPHYPDSVFHVTLYDGKSSEFARELLCVLNDFPWSFRVSLPELSTLTEIQIKGKKNKGVRGDRVFSPAIKELFKHLTSQDLDIPYLSTLSDERRLQIVRLICAHLHKATSKLLQLPSPINEPLAPLQESIGLVPGLKSSDLGPFITPPELAREIARYATLLLDYSVDFVDFGEPSVGTGSFFTALRQVFPHERINSAIGVEIDANRVATARQRWSLTNLEVINGDFLHMERLSPRNLILANPPYARQQHLSLEYKQKLRERASVELGMQISGLSGLYVYFLLLCHEWMCNGAVAAWLIPSEFMDTNYGAAIRQYLTQKVQLVRIHRFDPRDVQFENALVSSAVVVFRNLEPEPKRMALLSSGGSLTHPEHEEEVSIAELHREGKWGIPWRRERLAERTGPCIGDLFTVARGIATGSNDFFILERTVAARHGIPEDALRPVLPKARVLQTDIIEREEDGYPAVYPQLCLLDCHLPEEDIKRQFPRLMDYLNTAQDKGVRDRSLVKSRKIWYQQEQRNAPPFLCTYMGRGGRDVSPLRFIWNKSNAVATNVYLMLYPREALSELMSKQPHVQAEIYDLLRKTASEELCENGRIYGGGLHKIEPRELLKVRLPSFPSWLPKGFVGQLPLT